MQQKFISHPDQSSIVNLSKVDIVNRSHENEKPLIVFSAFGSEDYSAWAFDTHEQAREVYDWVLEQLPVVRYSQFGPVQMAEQIKHMTQTPPADLIVSISPTQPTPAELSELYRNSVTIDGIIRQVRKFYFGLSEGSVDVIIREIQAMPEGATFELHDIHCSVLHYESVKPLLFDLGCVTSDGNVWQKTDIPF